MAESSGNSWSVRSVSQESTQLAVLLVASIALSSCSPPLVWGGDEATKERLLAIVPIGSSVDALEHEASSRDWRISSRDDRSFAKGQSQYFGDGCQYQGGVSRYIIVAEYGVLTTSVETVWLFDEHRKLGDLCIRRTTDAP